MTTALHPKRRAIPLSVKLDVALRALGVKASDIDWSHEPALELRAINDDGTDWKPPQHDPAFLLIRKRAEHDHITFKDNGTGRGDLTAIAHARGVRDDQRLHQAKLAVKAGDDDSAAELRASVENSGRLRHAHKIPARANAWPQGRKIPSRGFQRGKS